MRIHGIEFKEGDGGEVMDAIEKCFNVIGNPFHENEIGRARGIGKPFLDKERKLGNGNII